MLAWVGVASSGASTFSVSVRALCGSLQVVTLYVHPGAEAVAAGVAVLGVSVTVTLGLYVMVAAPAVVGAAVTFPAPVLHV